ncbi:sugar ABC transporter ATP-binding protein [Robinsoniella peoriensis]|uniref:Galactose/methyl galactoside import ATP-binding protein MglA n=1 Tax=Robinsoniella peoriensis TaxID=180332 RepID=A0A4U8QAD9_9FIRM|nr:sugar ABC transporter ATP-binding protein [Robinsoniella peoriensis]TLD01424.1 Galactose/methyl galactoside import ATP-binding protein MglA [Robinsoniella peoriensis]
MLGNTILKLNHISKLYPGVVALDDLNIEFKEGEIHAMVGENGAGKSTMIKTISGAVQPTRGTIEINNHTYEQMTPTLSRQNGIAVIYQEFTLIPVLSASENIFLGEFIMKGMVLDRKEMDKKAEELFNRLHVDIDPSTKVADLTTGYQQIVEIAKAVSKDAKILIMDEPSAPLTTSEVEAMFKIVDTLKTQGVTIIYISHRMEEIFRLSDRVSVLRDGKYITTVNTADTSKSELIKLMVGRELSETYPERKNKASETVLSIKKLTGNGVKDVSFDVKRGEVLGLAGLIGAGRTELAQLLFGYEKIISGEIILNGKSIRPKNCIEAIAAGIALVPEDRKRQGLVLEMSIKENTTMPSMKRISTLAVISSDQEKEMSQSYMDSLRTKAPSIEQKTKNLSGGNQQKVVLAKWLAMDPQVLIFDEPTRGIDVGAKQEIYNIMNELADNGKTILMISSDMEELIGMSDRIVVLCKGRVTGLLEKEEVSQELILSKSAGSDTDE